MLQNCKRVTVTQFPDVFTFHLEGGGEVEFRNVFDLGTTDGTAALAAFCSDCGFGTTTGLYSFLKGMDEFGTGVLLDKSLAPYGA